MGECYQQTPFSPQIIYGQNLDFNPISISKKARPKAIHSFSSNFNANSIANHNHIIFVSTIYQIPISSEFVNLTIIRFLFLFNLYLFWNIQYLLHFYKPLDRFTKFPECFCTTNDLFIILKILF